MSIIPRDERGVPYTSPVFRVKSTAIYPMGTSATSHLLPGNVTGDYQEAGVYRIVSDTPFYATVGDTGELAVAPANTGDFYVLGSFSDLIYAPANATHIGVLSTAAGKFFHISKAF